MNEQLKKEILKLWEESRKDLSPSDKGSGTRMKNIMQTYDNESLAILACMAWVAGNMCITRIASLLDEHEGVQ